MMMKRAALPLLLSLSFLLQGCAILFGSVKPMTGKSDSYDITSPGKKDRDWLPVPREELDDGKDADSMEPEVDLSDRTFQSKATGALISINSACRPEHEYSAQDLRKYTDLLLLGFSDIKARQEQNMALQGVPALETTVEGRIGKSPVKVRTVVARKRACLYDMMYVTKPETFDRKENAFTGFVGSFRFTD